MKRSKTAPTWIILDNRSRRSDKNDQMINLSFGNASGGIMWDFMAVTKALADENRVRMLLALQKQELCLCQLIELVKLAPSTVSKHMSILRSARLVDARKDGRWMYYRLVRIEIFADRPRGHRLGAEIVGRRSANQSATQNGWNKSSRWTRTNCAKANARRNLARAIKNNAPLRLRVPPTISMMHPSNPPQN